MNLTPDDPRLSAYLLGELSAEDAAEVAREIEQSPELRESVFQLEEAQRWLVAGAKLDTQSLHPEQRQRVLRRNRQITWFHRFRKQAVPVGIGAAALIALTTYWAFRSGRSSEPAVAMKSPTQLAVPAVTTLPYPGPKGFPSDEKLIARADQAEPQVASRAAAPLSLEKASAAGETPKAADAEITAVAEPEEPLPSFPQLVPLPFTTPQSDPSMALPLSAGNASLQWIEECVRKRRVLPPADAVRVEELIHAFGIRAQGETAILEGVSLSVETLRSPWKPSGVLAVISWRGAAKGARNVSGSFHPDRTTVSRYRLLGFSKLGAAEPRSDRAAEILAEGEVTTLVLEIEPSASGNLGVLRWQMNGRSAPELVLPMPDENEPSEDAKFAALVSAFALWLGPQAAEGVDAAMVAALARENAVQGLAADRFDFLILIDQALGL